jgi:uroporphyrinogen-III synthase
MSEFSQEKTYALFASPLNQKRLSQLQKLEIETIIFPTITVTESNYSTRILQSLSEFDWLIFPDVYAVEFFVNSLEKLDIDLFELDSLRVLAYGEAVADRLRFSQLHADVIPPTVKTSDVLQSLKDYIFDEDEFARQRFLVLKKKNAEIDLVKELPNVSEMEIYEVEIKDESEIPKLKALLKGGAIDEFIFSSHYDVLNLAQLFQTENLADLLEGMTLTATDNLTLQSLQEFRLIEK